MGEPLNIHRSFTAYLRHRFDTGAAMRLEEVNSIHDWYQYWNRSLVPGLYGNNTRQYTFPGAQLQTMLKIDGDRANNRLFGVARLRSVRVQPGIGCVSQPTYKTFFPTCYGPYTMADESFEAHGPVDSIGGPLYKHTEDTTSKPHWGYLGSYRAGGFMQIMHSNYTGTLAMMDVLIENKWLAESTRAVFFEFTVYNLNLGLYAVCRITFEIAPVGGWLKSFDIDILDQRHLKPLGDKGLMAWILLVMEAVIVIFVVRYLCEEMSEFLAYDHGKFRIKWEYFGDMWNIIDWSNLTLMIVVMAYRFINWGIAGKIGVVSGSADYSNLQCDNCANLHDVVENVRLIRQLTAFNCVLTWFKAVKYINILPYISTFMETMALSWKYMVGWVAIFITSFMGFCLSYSTAFGESISDFRTVPRAFVFLMRAFIGNADMRLVYNANPVIGSMLTLFFIVSMIFVNMNLFYAIVISTLSEARQSQEMEQAKENDKFVEKCVGFVESVSRVFQLAERFRGMFPGLYTRMRTWENAAKVLETKRDDKVEERKKAALITIEEGALGSASPDCGRRRKRVFKQELEDPDAEDDVAEEVESEPDLGPLRFREQLEPQEEYNEDEHHHHHHHEHHEDEDAPVYEPPPPGAEKFFEPEAEELPDRDEKAKELVLEATEHVVTTIKDRCKGARNLVIGEMGECRQVLHGIGNVLEVLGRRARSLEAQQEQVLPPEVVARCKQQKVAEEEIWDNF